MYKPLLHPDIWTIIFERNGSNLEHILELTAKHCSEQYDAGERNFIIGPGEAVTIQESLMREELYPIICQDITKSVHDYVLQRPRPSWKEYFELIKIKNYDDYN